MSDMEVKEQNVRLILAYWIDLWQNEFIKSSKFISNRWIKHFDFLILQYSSSYKFWDDKIRSTRLILYNNIVSRGYVQ